MDRLIPPVAGGGAGLATVSFAEKLGIVGVLFVAFFGRTGVAGGYIGLALVAIASLMMWRHQVFRLLLRSPVTIVSLILVVYVLVWRAAMVLFDSEGVYRFTGLEWSLLLIPWLTFWFCRFPQLLSWGLGLAGLGLVYESVVGVIDNLDAFKNVLETGRVFAGRAWGLYLSSATLGLMIFMPRVFRWCRKRKAGLWLFTVYVLSTAWMLQCVFASKERVAWASFLVVFLGVLCLAGYDLYRKKKKNKKVLVVAALSVVLSLSGMFILNSEAVSKRFENDRENIQKILAGDESYSYTSATYRYLIFKYGVEQWQSSPLFGLGPKDSKSLIQKSTNPELQSMAHFHSSYLEILVQLGLVGLLMFVVLVATLIKSSIKGYRSGYIAGDYFLLGMSVLVMTLIYMLMGSRLTHPDWLFHWIFVVGMVQTFGLIRHEDLNPEPLCTEYQAPPTN